MNDPQRIQILREIDKLDKIGIDGVCAMLGDGMRDSSGAFNKGAGLMPIQVAMLRLFFEQTTGHETNDATLNAMQKAFHHLSRCRARIDLMCLLEETVIGDETAWDRLLHMLPNDDQTWANNGRPENIGWALDDMVKALNRAQQGV